jgi:PAS domain S-box-containing protein
MNRLMITQKLTLSFILFAGVMLLVLGLTAYLMARNSLYNATISELLSTSLEKESALNDWGAANQLSISNLASQPDLRATVATLVAAAPESTEAVAAAAATLSNLENWVGAGKRYLHLEVIDTATGKVIVSTAPQQTGKSRESDAFFIEGLRNTNVQSPAFDLEQQHAAMTAGSPIYAPDGKLIAVLGGLLNMDAMSHIIERRTGLRQTDDAFLVNTENLLVTEPHRSPDAAVRQQALQSEAIERCLAYGSGILHGLDYRGIPAIIAYRWLPERQLCLITKIDQAEAYAAANELGTLMAVNGGVILLAGSFVAFGLAHSIARPLKQVADAARAFGQGELDRRTTLTANDEIGLLAAEFNKMADALAAETSQLRRQSEHLFQLSTDLVCVTGTDGYFRMLNPSWTRVLGYSETELRSRPFLEFVHPEDLASTLAVTAGLAQGQGITSFENRYRCQDGAYRWLHWNAASAPAEGLIYAIAHDITERHAAEQQIRAINERFQLATRAAGMGIWDWDIQQDRLDWDERVFTLFGVDEPADMDAHNIWLQRTHPEDRAHIDAAIGQTLRDGAEFDDEFRVIWPDGGTRYIKIYAMVLRDDAGAPRRMIGANFDITARREAENDLAQRSQDLARSNAELERFAYVASHDLQEPLRMVTSYMQLIARRYRGQLDADADEFIGFAVDGANRMKALINDLLAYSRVGTRGKPFAPTDCEEALAYALANLQIAIKESAATVTHDPLPTVLADEQQLVQLLQNLIGNGLKFHSAAPPQIHISASAAEQMWTFAVRDNGIGVEPEYFERIFIVFQRLHGKDEYPGTGIGLAVCKKIVERHNGRIWVESTPGAGSTFYFTLPVAEPAAVAASPQGA